MSRFEDNYDEEGAIPYGLWNTIVENALGGKRGQQALAELEQALLALPEPVLIEGHLAADGQVCAIGAYVAHKRAQAEGTSIAETVKAMSEATDCYCTHSKALHTDDGCAGVRYFDGKTRCSCTKYQPDTEDAWQTVDAGQKHGLRMAVAYHLAHLNDEKYADATPQQRYQWMLEWVRRAQGKTATPIAG